MPSSGNIRSQLGPALKALKDHLAAATNLVTGGADRDFAQLRAECHHLGRTLNRVDNLNEKWSEFINSLKADDVRAEEHIYQNFPPQPEGEEQVHFMEVAEQARGVLNEIDFLIMEFDERANSQASRVSDHTLEDQNQIYNLPNRENQPNQFGQQNNEHVNHQFNHTAASHIQPEVRLPELRLDPFNGDPKKWPTFWQLFSINIDSRPMDKIRKMSYLLTFLHGPAKELVAGFMLSNENYERALDLLKSRYGDNRAITEALESELMNLHHANESSQSLRSFVDNIERICRQLEAYGQVDSSPFVSTAIKSKLPQQIVAKLVEKERSLGVRWNSSQLRKELCEIVEIREEVNRCTASTRGKQEANTPLNHRGKVQPKGGSPEVNRSFGAPASMKQNSRRPFRRQRKCSLCDILGHLPSECPKYPTPQDRYHRLREQGRCFRCLQEGHSIKECPSVRICAQCQRGHHFLVCMKGRPNNQTKLNQNQGNIRKPQKNVNQMAVTKQNDSATGLMSTQLSINHEENRNQTGKLITGMAYAHLRKKQTAYLMTRKIAIASPKSIQIGDKSKQIPAFVFFDPGSQLSYISKSFVDKLQPPQIARDDIEVHGFGGTLRDPIRIRSPSYAISIQREDGGWEQLELNWTKEISTSFEMANWVADMPKQASDLPEVQQAIELSTEVPGIMLGTRHFWKYFMGRTEVAPGLYVIQTAFGPVVGGEADMSPQGGKWSHSLATISQTNVDQMPPINTVEEFWNLESIGIRENPASDDDQLAINQLKSSIVQDSDGRYSVSWLWREPRALLPSNYRMAYSRLCSTYTNLSRSKELLEKYNKVFQDYLSQGIIEPAKKNPEGQEHYLAHHAVITHKIRPVFDASAHPRGQPSLNDCLLRGPVLLPELVGLLIRFRLPKFVAISDIESAFLMVGLHQADREVAKFLWIKDLNKPPEPSNMQVFRFTRVAFGVMCSPYLLAGVIRHHLDKYGPGVAAELASSLYVDNLHLGAESWPELLDKCQRAKDIFTEARMNLREFSSNSEELIRAIPVKDRLDNQEPKVLGMRWNVKTDLLSFQLPSGQAKLKISRRTVLSSLAGIYDPLGLLSPSVLPAKIFFQQLWDEGHDWDRPLSEDEISTWEYFLNGWKDANISLPRRVVINNQEELTLIPGWTHHGINISLTPTSVSNPPAPILGIPFLTHGFSVALGKNVPLDLKCPDIPSVRGFGCNISEEACRDCRHSSDTVTCQCREFDAEAILADPEMRLPLTIGRHTFLTENDQVYVEQTYTPIQVHLQMENFQLISQITETACKITPTQIRGCYKCLKGVQVDFTCTTDFGTALAYIRCADGINFITRCSFNGTTGTAAFTYTRSKIDTFCSVKCPGGKSEFKLKGDLTFIPISWKEREIIESLSEQRSGFRI
jgi:hypothetical protein